MLTALSLCKTIKFVSYETEKISGPFFCPGCCAEVVLKKGNKKIHHFAHKTKCSCAYAGESEEHLTTKHGLYRALKESDKISAIELEKSFEDTRADVYFETVRGEKVAIEVQKSSIDPSVIYKRTKSYGDKGIAIIWILAGISPTATGAYMFKLKEWQKYLNSMYFGRIFIWEDGLLIKMFSDKNRNFIDKKNLIDDFYVSKRQAGSFGGRHFPSSLLWTSDFGDILRHKFSHLYEQCSIIKDFDRYGLDGDDFTFYKNLLHEHRNTRWGDFIIKMSDPSSRPVVELFYRITAILDLNQTKT